MNTPQGTAAAAWRQALESWAIPPEILARAPESPWGCPISVFENAAEHALAATRDSPSRARAREALPEGGAVLDVGAGAGAASLPLVPPARTLIAVDSNRDMLQAFAKGADRVGAAHIELEGQWPGAEAEAPVADVAVCHHVAYNVGDLAGLFAALNRHARRRVVVELTQRHPQSDLSGLWKRIHGIDRPTEPTAEGALAVAIELGFDAHLERFHQTALWHGSHHDVRVLFARRRLCVGPEYDPLISEWLAGGEAGQDREMATVWWDTGLSRPAGPPPDGTLT